MYVCMYVCIHINVYVCIYAHTCVYVCVCVCFCVRVCVSFDISLCLLDFQEMGVYNVTCVGSNPAGGKVTGRQEIASG